MRLTSYWPPAYPLTLGLLEERDDLRPAVAAARAGVEVARGGVPHGLQEPGRSGVTRLRPAAPYEGGPPAAARAAHGGNPDRSGGGHRPQPCALARGELHPEAGVVDDDLRWVAVDLRHAQGGLVVEPRRSGVHTHLTE